jgi:hypothetical protein
MKEYTFSEARQKLSALLNRARDEGSVRIRRRDGQKFIIQPENRNRSPFEVDGVNLDVTRDEIVEIIRASRKEYEAQ